MNSRSQTNKKVTTSKRSDYANITSPFASSMHSSFYYYATHSKERAAASARFRAQIASSKSTTLKAR